MLFDTHMHCEFSCDSEMTLVEAMASAKKQGIGMIVTEHWDYDYPTNPEEFLFDLDAYFKNFEPYHSVDVLRGIEIGMQRHTTAKDELVAVGRDFDYVLGSIHCMGKKDIYEPDCYTGRERADVIQEFLDDTIYCLENHNNYDAFAHIDYICRYWPYTGVESHLSLQDSPAKFDRLFRLLIQGNKPIEINTRRLGNAEALAALIPLYRRYQELGGKYCTIGSDAHRQEHIGRDLHKALEIAKIVALKPVYFRERKMQLMEL